MASICGPNHVFGTMMNALKIALYLLLKTVEFECPVHRRGGDVRRVAAEPDASRSSSVVLNKIKQVLYTYCIITILFRHL